LRRFDAPFEAPAILLFDTDLVALTALADALLLRLRIATITTATSLEAARYWLEHRRHDLVICDAIQRSGEGFALVLLLTASIEITQEDALHAGAWALITKPATRERLFQTIEALLKKRRETSQPASAGAP
jgi:CheY-like chemotaxis protein